MSGYILMRDAEGWARLYDVDVPTAMRDLGQHYQGAETANEDPGKPYYLPGDSADVTPVSVRTEGTAWDDEERATVWIEFRPMEQNGKGDPVARVSYGVDGRS